MNFPVSAETARWLAIPMGILFGVLLHRGGVANYNVIVNQFRFKDFTVLQIMFTAIIVGGIEQALKLGHKPEVFISSNTNGDDHNEKLLQKYRSRIRHL